MLKWKNILKPQHVVEQTSAIVSKTILPKLIQLIQYVKLLICRIKVSNTLVKQVENQIQEQMYC